MHRLLLLLCGAHVKAGGSTSSVPLPSLHLVRCRPSSALVPRSLRPPSSALLLLLRPRRAATMPSCAAPTPGQETIEEVASRLTESTLKRALACLISEAIEADAGTAEKEEEEGVEATARKLVADVLKDSWTFFLQECDLQQWLQEEEGSRLSQRMASEMLQRVQSEDVKGAGKVNSPQASGAQEQTVVRSASNIDLGFFESPREHTDTDTLYPKAGGGGCTRLSNGDDERRATGGSERGAVASCDATEIRFHFDNSECRIDLRAVKPFDGVILQNNSIDKEGNEVSVLLFDASQLPYRSMPDYDHLMQQIFLYSLYMVEQHMYANYSIVYLHGNASKEHWPRAKWLRQWCHALNSKTTKHLTQLFVVYPTLWIRTLRVISRPFVKFKSAVHFVSSLRSLIHHLPEAEAVIPKRVRENDNSL